MENNEEFECFFPIQKKGKQKESSKMDKKQIRKKYPKRKKKADEDHRIKKDNWQIQMLKKEFDQNSEWDTSTVNKIAQKSQLSKQKVYKWNWDQKQKAKRNQQYNSKSSQQQLMEQGKNEEQNMFKIPLENGTHCYHYQPQISICTSFSSSFIITSEKKRTIGFLSRNLILLEKKEEIDEEIIKFEEKN